MAPQTQGIRVMASPYKWTFKARFRTNAYSWKGTSLASKRLKEAVSEIKKMAKSDPVLAGEGCVALMERLWPALQGIDSSSGALGGAVNRTLDSLIPILIAAPAAPETRVKWLEQIYDAICNDGVQYLTPVEERWGKICGFPELANEWADQILPMLRQAWGEGSAGAHVVGDTLCLSCLLETGRYHELDEVLRLRKVPFWHNDKFLAEALARTGQVEKAIECAEAHLARGYAEYDILKFCERVLLDAGRREEAYKRYGILSVVATNNLTTFRKTVAKYPERDPRQVLLDLISLRGEKGKWFAAAKDAGYLDIALDCASTGETEPKTLVRAARDFADTQPEFSAKVALVAIKALLEGRGYEPTTLDIRDAYDHLLTAAGKLDTVEKMTIEVRRMLANDLLCMSTAMREALAAKAGQPLVWPEQRPV
jgi:tetratricopeptide (TPR) repeat protein